ncbi:thioesterase family protein [Streptomyces sp. NPDC005438]|uniref:acyl-CoA thioesterase n=1 Tax=Streptomyces sp. NPDC005438 TaxID=3156880 RepID=UPI0033AB22EE
MRHQYQCAVRWSDMDVFGHVNNVVFLRYLEEARIDLLFRLARQEYPGSFAGGSVVARHEIDYLKPLVHGHRPVTVETWVTKIRFASAILAYEVKDERLTYVRASTVIVPYDLDRSQPRRLTQEETSFLERYLDDRSEGTLTP